MPSMFTLLKQRRMRWLGHGRRPDLEGSRLWRTERREAPNW